MPNHSTEGFSGRLPVLVLGGGITGLGVVRILARNRIPSWVAAAPGDLALASRHARPTPVSSGNTWRDDPVGWLRGLPIAAAVPMPCSDQWAGVVASLPEDLTHRFPASIARPEALAQAVDKGRFAELLQSIGVPHPRTWPVASAADLNALPPDAFAHAFLKPRDSQRFFARFGVKGFWVTSPAEAAERLAQLEAEGLEVQLQEYVAGPAANHVFVDGFVDAAGVVKAILVRRRLRMYPLDFGNSTLMVTIAPDQAAPAVDAVRRMLEAMRFRGIFSVEFKQSETDGRWYALEMNARPWWYVDYAARVGVDVIRLAWLDAQALPVPEVREYSHGLRCVYPYYDWHAVRASGGVAAAVLTWLTTIPGADQPVWRLTDPVPTMREMAALLRRKLAPAKGGR